MPETSLLNPLADLLGVSVGELLAGQHIQPERMKEQTDQIILESLAYSDEDRILKRILRYICLGIVVAIGGMFFALVMDRFFNGAEDLSVGIGMYLCIVAVTCTGIVVTHIDGKV